MTGTRPVAVVTGASAGVGRATAIELARRGCDVALVARGEAGLDAARIDVEKAGGRALALPVDVADAAALQAAGERAERELGPVAIWVNDAMTTVFSPFDEVGPADFQRAVEVTFLGQVWGTAAALRLMRPRNAGTIVNVGSALAYIGIPLQSAYCASKFACRGFFQSTRAELLHEGSRIRMCMVHLPAVNTPQFEWCQTTLERQPQPVPPIYQPEVPARAIAKSAFDGKPVRVVGSWNKLLVAAGSLMPNLGNHYAAVGAWESQLTKEKVEPGRQVNLRSPVDVARDHGARGRFGDQAGGFLEPQFLRTLPQAAANFARAAAGSASDSVRCRLSRRAAR